MKTLASAALFLGVFGLVACGGDDGPSFVDGGGGDARQVCNPVTQQGCESGEKCASLIESVDPVLVRTACVENGTVPVGGACTVGDPGPTGFDDCEASSGQGNECINGICTEVCSTSPNTCGTGFVCVLFDGLFDDVGDGQSTGACAPACDPVSQDCANAADGCYFQFRQNSGVCAGVPMPAADNTQDVACYGPGGDETTTGCFLNGCAKGHAAILPNDPDVQMPSFQCAFFCSPVDNQMEDAPAVEGAQAPPTQWDCNSANDVAANGDRVGPGAAGSHECRYLNSFYTDTGMVVNTIGFCVPVDPWLSCANFDLDGCLAAASEQNPNPPECAGATPGCIDEANIPASQRQKLQRVYEAQGIKKPAFFGTSVRDKLSDSPFVH